MLSELLSEQAEFARHLFREGYPLWSPDPARLPHERERDGIRIGDLGIVDGDGHFRLLLNVCETPQADRPNSPTGSLLIRESDIEPSFQKLPNRCVISSPQTTWSVDPEHDSNAHRHQPRRSLYQAELTSDGTHILLPHGADKFELSPSARSQFEDLARRHGREWYTRAKEVFMLESEPLYLITGFYKTCSWALASLQIRTDSQIRVRCNVVERGVRHILRDESLWNPTGRFQHKIGPGPENEGRKNQSVFISGFVITPRRPVSKEEPPAMGLSTMIPFSSWFLNRPVKDTTEPGTMEEMEVSIDQIPRVQHRDSHPGDVINRYLLEKEPSAEVAVTHDTVWMTLAATGKLSTIEDLERFLEQGVGEDYLITAINGVVCLDDKGLHMDLPPSPLVTTALDDHLEDDQCSSSCAIPLSDSTHLTTLSASVPSISERPTLTLPKSEPLSGTNSASLQPQDEVKRQQAVEPGDPYIGLNLQYIFSRRSEGSIHSFGSDRLSFVLGNPLSTSGLSIASQGSLTLSIDDGFLRHLQKYDRRFNKQRYHWSFIREKADPSISSGSSRHKNPEGSRDFNPAKPIKEMSSKVQEMWRCGQHGRFKVDRPVVQPRSADRVKGPQQRIHIRNVADPYIKASTTGGPHSVIHKHSRSVAFSIFRAHGLFSSRKLDGDTQMQMDMRHGFMLAPKKVQEQYTSTTLSLVPPPPIGDRSFEVAENYTSLIPPIRYNRGHNDSLDSDDRLPTSTPHAEAFGTLDLNDIEHYRTKANNRAATDSGGGLAKRFLRTFRSGLKSDSPSPSMASQPGVYRPPWMVTSSRDQQEEHELVLKDLNDSFNEVGLLATNPHKASGPYAKQKSKDGILDQIPDDTLYMLLPLWAGNTGTAGVHPESSSSASSLMPEKRQYLLVYYAPPTEATDLKGKKPENKLPHYLPSFRVFARVIAYNDLRYSGVRLPSSGLAINSPEGETVRYPVSAAQEKMSATVVCLCEDRERGFDFLEDGLHDLGLCERKEPSIQSHSVSEDEERESDMVLTPIGRAVVEMIWLGCLAVTSFGPSQP